MATKSTKRGLIVSALAILICFTMLLGTTYAWFTDSVTSAGNIIKTGTLDVSLESKKAIADDYKDASEGAIFEYQNWEPGYTEVRYVKIENEGSLDLKFKLNIIPTQQTAAGEVDLAEVIDVYMLPGEQAVTRDQLAAATPVGTLAYLMADADGAAYGKLYDKAEGEADTDDDKNNVEIYTIVLKMRESAGNEYQDRTVGGSFVVQLVATQLANESDDLGDDYDTEAIYPGNSEYVTLGNENVVLTTVGDNATTITLPAELVTVLAAAGTTKVQLATGAVSADEDEDGNVTVTYTSVEILDQNGEELDLDGNTTAVPVKLYVGTEYAGKYATVKHDGTTIATVTVAADGYINYSTTHFCKVTLDLTDELPKVEMDDVKDETVEDLTKLIEVLVGEHYYTVSQGMANSWYEYPSVPGKIEADIYVPEDLIAFSMMYNNGDLTETGSHSDLTLVNDLDFTGYNWVPIGRFCTNIHGNNKTISNLNDSFLGCVYDCQIYDLTLENVTATGSAAGVVGKELAGDMYISNLTIAGTNTVTYAKDNATNWPEEGTGVGAICGVSLIGCGGHGEVAINVTGTIEVNYNGVFFGNNTNLDNLGVDTNFGLNVYKKNVNAVVTVADGGSITTNGQGYLFDVADLEDGFALDKITNNYYVLTANGLAVFAADVNAGNKYSKKTVVLFDNIDLQNNEWTPIGTDAAPFEGTFDGNGKTVFNLLITGNKSSVGLFGRTNNGEIKNLTVENAKVTGYLNVGVVAGTPYTSKYTNITVTGHVEVNGFSYVGGVGGKNAYANWNEITVDVDDTSYVNANSVDGTTAYRTYVGGVIGFMGEGTHKVTNVVSNIDVIGSTCDVGGIVGIAHQGNSFENIVCSGNVKVTAPTEAADAEEMGGIAGVWHNGGKDVIFNNCKFTGALEANFEGVNLKDNTIVGKAYSTTGTAKLVIDGVSIGAVFTEVSGADDLNAALNNNANVVLSEDITVPSASAGSNAYGSTGINVTASQTFDGNGNSFGVDKWGTWDSAISTTGGLIKNVTINSGFRGIFINHNSDYSSKVILENVIVDGTVYTISCDQGTNKGLQAINSTFNGWTSYAATIGNVEFIKCNFGKGQDYAFCRPYAPTTFENCVFEEGFEIGAQAAVTLTNCYYGDTLITADNIADLGIIVENPSNVTVVND